MNARRRSKRIEKTRNTILVLLAVAMVVIFFNLDVMNKGESVFSRSADKKLKFMGDLSLRDFSDKEIDRILKFIKRNTTIIDRATVETSVQDTYKKITDKSQVIFEIHLTMVDGAKISTTTRRTTRKNLVSSILAKLKKDIGAYKQLIKEGKKVKSLVNTM